MNRRLPTLLAVLVLSATSNAAHVPTIQFSTHVDPLRDQVLKASGARYTQNMYYAGSPNQPIRDIVSGSTVAIPARKPTHQYQVNSLVGSTGAAGGWVGFDSYVPEGFVYTPTQGTTYIAPMPGHARTNVTGVSADGNAALGKSFSGSNTKDFYWTRGGQTIDLYSATGSNDQQKFTPQRMRADGVVEGYVTKSGPSYGVFDATWSPSQGLTVGPQRDATLLGKATSAAGTIETHYDIINYTGDVRFTTPNGQASTFLTFHDSQGADPVAVTPDGTHAIINADTDQGDNLMLPRALAVDVAKSVELSNAFAGNPFLSDYLLKLGLDPAALEGKILYDVLAASPDGRLLFGSAGTDELWYPETTNYFLIDFGPTPGGQPTPEPSPWLIFATALGAIRILRRPRAPAAAA